MTLTQLRYLVAIADAGCNITQAAERVHATQPGLSKQLKQLEDELGFQLFLRKGRSLESIAPAGVRVLEHARRILAETANIRSYAANERGEYSGRLLLATTHTQAQYVLPDVIAALAKQYPQVSVDLFAGGDAEVLDKLGEADFALISTAGATPDVNGVAIPLFRWRRVLLVQATHPLARGGATDLASLAHYPLISYESSTQPDSSLQRAFASVDVQPKIAMTARDASLIKTYVRTGLGVGILAEMAVSAREDADLRVLAAPEALPECMTWAVVPKGRVLRDYALALLRGIAPHIDLHDMRRILEGNQEARWPEPPRWQQEDASIGRGIGV